MPEQPPDRYHRPARDPAILASRLTLMICTKVAECHRRDEQGRSGGLPMRREGGPAKFPCQFPAGRCRKSDRIEYKCLMKNLFSAIDRVVSRRKCEFFP